MTAATEMAMLCRHLSVLIIPIHFTLFFTAHKTKLGNVFTRVCHSARGSVPQHAVGQGVCGKRGVKGGGVMKGGCGEKGM